MATSISPESLASAILVKIQEHLSEQYDKIVEEKAEQLKKELMEKKSEALTKMIAIVMQNHAQMGEEMIIRIPMPMKF